MCLIKQQPVKSKRRFVDVKLLKKQAASIGWRAAEMESSRLPKERRNGDLLNGIWELLHAIIDDLEVGKECVLELPGRRTR